MQVSTRSPRPGESGHGFLTPAARDDEARDLGEAAGDEGGDGVVAQSESVANAGGDGDDVLERASEFDSDDVVVGVNAETGIAELALHGGGKLRVGGGDGDGRGMAVRDFLRERRPAERADARGEGDPARR